MCHKCYPDHSLKILREIPSASMPWIRALNEDLSVKTSAQQQTELNALAIGEYKLRDGEMYWVGGVDMSFYASAIVAKGSIP